MLEYVGILGIAQEIEILGIKLIILSALIWKNQHCILKTNLLQCQIRHNKPSNWWMFQIILTPQTTNHRKCRMLLPTHFYLCTWGLQRIRPKSGGVHCKKYLYFTWEKFSHQGTLCYRLIIIAEVLFLLSLFKKIFSTVTRYLSEYNAYLIGNIG